MTLTRLPGLALLTALPLLAAGQVVDDFDGGVTQWDTEMRYGDVAGCRSSSGEGTDASSALRVDYVFGSAGTNHIIYSRPVELDLSWKEGLSFDVRGVGDPVMVFLFLWDSQGRFRNYGPHGTNHDFHTGHANWHTCHVSFDTDRSVQGGDADLTHITRLGFMLNQNGSRTGTVWFENLRATDASGTIEFLSPSAISPNGDGVYDTLDLRVHLPREARVTLKVSRPDGEVLATPVRDRVPESRAFEVHWDATVDGKVLPDGEYLLGASFGLAGEDVVEARFTLDTTRQWPPLKYQVEPFFPIGVWFEGHPSLAGYPADPVEARGYYNRCFADLAAHGFNAVGVPNCPESLWETLLQSAEEHGIHVVLEVGPIVGLVSSGEPVPEGRAYEAIKRVVDKIGKYDSLLRYQVRDEPSPEMVPNWLLVRRLLAALDPKRPSFSCFCNPASLERATAGASLSEAVFDIYPHRPGTPPQRLGHFLPALASFKAATRGSTLWAVLQAFAKEGVWRYPSAEELRAVTYLSLAAGAKGVFYFIYQTMPAHAERLEGLIEPDGCPRPLYGPATALARELGKLSPLLLSLGPADQQPSPEGDAQVGAFVDAEGHPVLVVASTRPDQPVSATLKGLAVGRWEDALTSEVFEVRDGVLTVPLKAGAGRVLKGG